MKPTLLLGFFVCAACSTGSPASTDGGKDGPASGGNVFCTTPPHDGGGLASNPKGCFVYHNVSAGTDETSACSALGGMITSSCPSSGLYGCCTTSNGKTEQCYYDETDAGAEVAMAACSAINGTWSTTIVM